MINSDDSGYSGKGIGVCVLDTGIFSHIDFTGRIRAFQDFIGHRISRMMIILMEPMYVVS